MLGSWLIPPLGRRIHWLGKKELFDWPIVGWIAANGGVHPVDRGAADVEAFRLAKRILDEGHVLFVFPEGTRSPDGRAPGGPRRGRASSPCAPARRSCRSASPARTRVWPRGQKLPHPGGRVTVRVGRAVPAGRRAARPGTDRKAAKGLADRR